MIKVKPTNECIVEVYPRYAGNFGWVRISGQSRTPEEEYKLCEEIKHNILRHVDDVEDVSINQKVIYETSDGSEFNTLYEALEHECAPDEYLRGFICTYKKPSDNGVGSTCRRYSFRDVILEAYEHPWEFKVSGCTLTEYEKEFLDNVIKAGLENKNK